MWTFAKYLVSRGNSQRCALSWGRGQEKNFHGGLTVFNQITPISTPYGRGLQTACPAILVIILLARIGPPAAARPPDSLTTHSGHNARGASQSAGEELSLELGKPVERE